MTVYFSTPTIANWTAQRRRVGLVTALSHSLFLGSSPSLVVYGKWLCALYLAVGTDGSGQWIEEAVGGQDVGTGRGAVCQN